MAGVGVMENRVTRAVLTLCGPRPEGHLSQSLSQGTGHTGGAAYLTLTGGFWHRIPGE